MGSKLAGTRAGLDTFMCPLNNDLTMLPTEMEQHFEEFGGRLNDNDVINNDLSMFAAGMELGLRDFGERLDDSNVFNNDLALLTNEIEQNLLDFSEQASDNDLFNGDLAILFGDGSNDNDILNDSDCAILASGSKQYVSKLVGQLNNNDTVKDDLTVPFGDASDNKILNDIDWATLAGGIEQEQTDFGGQFSDNDLARRAGLDTFIGAGGREQAVGEVSVGFNSNTAVNHDLSILARDASNNNNILGYFDCALFDDIVLQGVDPPDQQYTYEAHQENAIEQMSPFAPNQPENFAHLNDTTTPLEDDGFTFVEQSLLLSTLDPRLLNEGLGNALDNSLALIEDDHNAWMTTGQSAILSENIQQSQPEENLSDWTTTGPHKDLIAYLGENEHDDDSNELNSEALSGQTSSTDEAEDDQALTQSQTRARNTRRRARESDSEEQEREGTKKRFKSAPGPTHQKAAGIRLVRSEGDRFEAAPRRQARTTAELSQEQYIQAYRAQGVAESKAKNCFRKRTAELERLTEQEEWKRQLDEAQAQLNSQGFGQDHLAEKRPNWWVTWVNKPFQPSRQYSDTADEQKKLKNAEAQFKSQQEKRALRFDLWQSARFYTRMAGLPGVNFFSEATLRPVMEDWIRLNGSKQHKPEMNDNIGRMNLDTLDY